MDNEDDTDKFLEEVMDEIGEDVVVEPESEW